MEDLTEIKDRAQHRRQERDAATRAEERELREALRLIEEFEREEARKAELLRVEQDRIEEERRQAEAEARLLREESRRREVASKYTRERETLEGVTDLQDTMLRYQHDKELSALRTKARSDKEALAAKHSKDRADSRAYATAKLEKQESAWKEDYDARVKVERWMEAGYRARLEGLWPNRPDRKEPIDNAVRSYMKKNDARHREYEQWRATELEMESFRIEEQQAIRDELMDHAARQLDESIAKQTEDMTRRQAAESRWAEVVSAERWRMLVEMEDVERESGGEDIGDDDFYSLPGDPEEEGFMNHTTGGVP